MARPIVGIEKMQIENAEAFAKSMRSNTKSGDKSLFPTTIVMLVRDSIKQMPLPDHYCYVGTGFQSNN
jgi:hypothetical protein